MGVNQHKGPKVEPLVVVPTLVGVNRHDVADPGRIRRPHARGGGPSLAESRRPPEMGLSPRSWGWTEEDPDQRHVHVVPTLVGVDRIPRRRGEPLSCPHARGDGPSASLGFWAGRRCPHARGDGPYVFGTWMRPQVVVPTLVGVDRHRPNSHVPNSCPHARGDGPLGSLLKPALFQRCPHARGGGPPPRSLSARRGRVVPTLVGVDRVWPASASVVGRCPHARGGGPTTCRPGSRPPTLSPRSWGWTVCRPGSVRTTRCPHARGGGPTSDSRVARAVVPTLVGVDRQAEHSKASLLLSPRSWGWTANVYGSATGRPVVPTLVGMDRPIDHVAKAGRCPHARGDGPQCRPPRGEIMVVPTLVGMDRNGPNATNTQWLSPRSWGWTAYGRISTTTTFVVPTLVGMDRLLGQLLRSATLSPRSWGWTGRIVIWSQLASSCPHARGDGPLRRPFNARRLRVPTLVGMDQRAKAPAAGKGVVPTLVGVDRGQPKDGARPRCPHARGGGPRPDAAQGLERVVPTLVGVDRTWQTQQASPGLSPRSWGWTL